MKESDGAEQPTTGHLRRARLGRITLWKSYALIRQEKTMIRGATGWKNPGFVRNTGFYPIGGLGLVRSVRLHGEQVKTSKAGDRATGENGDTCRTRLRPISATPEREAGDIAVRSHVLTPDAQCHWSISQAQSRQRCEKRLKRLRRCFFLSGW